MMLTLDSADRWEKTRLAALFKENKKKNTVLELIYALQFFFGNIVPKKQYELTEDLKATYEKYTVVAPGDIMINGLNLNYDFVSQRIAQVKDEGIITSAYIALRPREGINSRYYNYFFKAMDFCKLFHGMGTGIRLTLSFSDLKNMQLPVPPRDEQDQIVRFLDWKVSSINKLIFKRHKESAVLEELKAKIIDAAVIKGLRGAPLKHNEDVRWDIDYSSAWNLKRVHELFSFRKGLSITKANLEETGIPVINYGQIHSKKNTMVGLNDDILKYVNTSYIDSNPSCLVASGDFIFADTSEDRIGCGNCAYVDRDCDIFAGYHSIIGHPIVSTDNKYFAYLFKSPTWRYQIRKKVNGVKVYSITQQMLKDAFVLIPPEDEQREIVEYLDNICKKINALIEMTEQKIRVLEELKTRLISDAVTGQIDIRDIEIPEYERIEEDLDEDADAEFETGEIEEQED